MIPQCYCWIFIELNIYTTLVIVQFSFFNQHHMKALTGTLRKEAIVKVACWELKSHIFKALVLPTFTYGTEIWGSDLKNSHYKVSEKGMKMHVMSHNKVRSSTTYIISWLIWRTSHGITHSQAHYRLSTMAHPPIPLLVSQ